MNCRELAERIEEFKPDASTREVARLCLLLANTVDSVESLVDHTALSDAWQEMSLRLQAATDQHAAMTEELELLANSDPTQYFGRFPLGKTPPKRPKYWMAGMLRFCVFSIDCELDFSWRTSTSRRQSCGRRLQR